MKENCLAQHIKFLLKLFVNILCMHACIFKLGGGGGRDFCQLVQRSDLSWLASMVNNKVHGQEVVFKINCIV